jgi:hypothetical protein
MAHHLERRRVEHIPGVIMAYGFRPGGFSLMLIEIMTDRRAQQRAQRPADHEAKCSAKQFS